MMDTTSDPLRRRLVELIATAFDQEDARYKAMALEDAENPYEGHAYRVAAHALRMLKESILALLQADATHHE